MPRPVEARRPELVDALLELFLAEGFRTFSIEDLARHLGCSKSTLYIVAESKEQIVAAVVRAFFRRSTDRVEERLTQEGDPAGRIGVYLDAIATELSAASPEFFADLDAHPAAGEVYRQNTEWAAVRVRELLDDAGATSVDPTFAGVVVGLVMEAVHRGRIAEATGQDDAAAFRALAQLVTAGLKG